MVATHVGKTEFAAVNLIIPFPMLLSAVGFMVGTGGSALVSMKLGQGRKEEANEIFSMLIKVLTVTDAEGQKVRFDLHAFTNNKLPLFENILRQIPGHEFFNMAKVGLKSLDTTQVKDNASYQPLSNTINIGSGHFILASFLHEFGHNKDWKLPQESGEILRTDKELRKIYEEEQQAFIKEFPSLQRDVMSYFISLDNALSRTHQGIAESIAETNNILSTPYQNERLAFRKYYLQRYFPKTIAYIAKKINPDVYNQ